MDLELSMLKPPCDPARPTLRSCEQYRLNSSSSLPGTHRRETILGFFPAQAARFDAVVGLVEHAAVERFAYAADRFILREGSLSLEQDIFRERVRARIRQKDHQ